MARRQRETLSIGRLAERSGVSVSAIRFYESEGLIRSSRNAGGQRRFERGAIRRLAFVRITQGLGFPLAEIRAALATLPEERTPTKRDWERLARRFDAELERRIETLTRLRETLSGCIGCGCLSLERCRLYNPDDRAAGLGSGPRYLLGDRPADAERLSAAAADRPARGPRAS